MSMENPQPVALSAWRRAVSGRMLAIVRDTGHFTIAEDFARMFPWPMFRGGELPFGPTPERTRKPTGAQAFGPPPGARWCCACRIGRCRRARSCCELRIDGGEALDALTG